MVRFNALGRAEIYQLRFMAGFVICIAEMPNFLESSYCKMLHSILMEVVEGDGVE